MFYRQVMDQGFIKETPLWELSVFGFSVIALSKKNITQSCCPSIEVEERFKVAGEPPHPKS